VALSVGLATTVIAQEADADQAKALLKQGVSQFEARNYQQAKAALLKAAGLKAVTGDQKKTLDDYLVRVDPAIRKQRSALEAYRAGEKALKSGDLAEAKKQFSVAASSEFLRDAEIKDAKAELTAVEYKIKAVNAAKSAAAPAVKTAPPVAAVVTEPAVEPVTTITEPVVVTPAPVAVTEPVAVAVTPTVTTVATPEPVVVTVAPPTPKPVVAVEPVVVAVTPPAAPKTVTTTPEPVVVAVTPVTTPKPVAVTVAAPAPKPVAVPTKSDPLLTVVDVVDPVAAPATTVTTPAVTPVTTPATTPVSDPVVVEVKPNTNMLANGDARKKKAAAEHLAAGRRMLDSGNSAGAVSELQTAVALDPTSDEARKLLSLATNLSSSSAGGGGVLNKLIQRQNVMRGEATMEYEKSMQRSKELMASADSEADFTDSIEAAKTAGNIVDTSKSLFTADKYRQMQTAVTKQIEWVGLNRDKWIAGKAKIEQDQIQAAKTSLILQNENKRNRRIGDLTTKAKALAAGRNYAGAIEELKQILILDPDNRWANENRDLLENFTLVQEERGLIKDVHRESTIAQLDIRRSEIPWHQIVRYPKTWKEITNKRKPFDARSQAETEMDRVVRKQLDATLTKLEFEDMELSQVFQFLRDVSGANIHVKWKALALESIEPATTVNVHLTNVTFRKALDTILEDVATGGDPGIGETGLGYVIDEGVITISTKADLGKQTVVRVYDIRDMIVRVPMFEGPRLGRSTKGAGDSSSNSSGLFDPGAGGGDTGAGLEGDLKSRTEIIGEIKTLVTETVDRDSWRDAGGEAGAISEIGGQLVITQTIENHDSIVELIGKLREARALEVSIEARFITVSSGFLNRVGIDLDFYFNLGPKFIPPTGVTTPLTGGGRPMMGALQNGQGAGLNATLPAFTNAIGSGGTGVASLLSAGGVGAAAADSAFSFGGAFLDDVQVSFLIEATQAHDMTRMLTAPRITLFNGQRAYISLSTEETYVSGTESQVAGGGGDGGFGAQAQDIETDTVTSGTVLDVEATVSADRRYVTMTIRPQVSTSDLTNQVNVNPQAGAIDIPGQVGQQEMLVTLPRITTQDLQTTVSVPDGGTLLLGGQKTSNTVERELGVPVLSKVPFLRRLFTNTGDVRDESTLMIMVRPSIIIQSEKELEVNP